MKNSEIKKILQDELLRAFEFGLTGFFSRDEWEKKYFEKLTKEFQKAFKLDKFVSELANRFQKLANDFNIDLNNEMNSFLLANYLLGDIIRDLFSNLNLDSYLKANGSEYPMISCMVKRAIREAAKNFSNQLFDGEETINYYFTNVFNKYETLFNLATQNEKRLKDAYELKLLESNKELSELENKRRTFPIALMRKIKQIENSIPKQNQSTCVILANRELKFFAENDLIDNYGKPTQLLISIRDSYKAQKKNL